MNGQQFNSPIFPVMTKHYSFYHMGVKPPDPLWFLNPIQSSLETYLTSLNGDWFRYAGHSYVVWTDLMPLDLANGIRSVKGLENLIMLITPFQPDWANGYMPQEFWTWLRKPRFPRQNLPGL